LSLDHKLPAAVLALNDDHSQFATLWYSSRNLICVFVTTQIGSSLKLLMVAEGSAHIYPRLVPCCEWDTAAADIIVREAGGVVLQAGLCDGEGNGIGEDWKVTRMLVCFIMTELSMLACFIIAAFNSQVMTVVNSAVGLLVAVLWIAPS
jgi:fructose-1,6-bisphosphatase/inositol monophosphatase family enzyme